MNGKGIDFKPGEFVATFEGDDPATGIPLGSGLVADIDEASVLLDHANLGPKLVERSRIGSVLRSGEVNEGAV